MNFDRSTARLIDHTILKPEATRDEVRHVCSEALQFEFATVCVNSFWTKFVAGELRESPVKVCTVAGFPLGAACTSAKVAETLAAIRDGAQEIDMVINIGALCGGEREIVKSDIRAVVAASRAHDAIVKVILETALLDEAQKVLACRLSQDAGADFVKTSTGFSKAGATVSDVALMRRTVGASMGVKASGGIRTLADLRAMVAAGANRIGASSSVRIIKETASGKRQHPGRRQHPGTRRRRAEMATPRVKPAVRFRERSDLLDFLLKIATLTSETLELDELLGNVATIVRRVIPYDLFAILLYNEKRRDLRIRYAVGHREEVVRNLSLSLGEGVVGAAAQAREPVLVADVTTDPRYLTTSDLVRSELSVPMIARHRLVGVIDVQSVRPGSFRVYDRTMLSLIAGRIAAAIDNAQLYRRAERQYRTIRTLSRISNEFASILDIDELLSKIASSVHGLISYDAFSILLVDTAQGVLRHRFSNRLDQRVDLDNIPIGKGITGAAATSREVVRVHDTTADPRYIASHQGIRSEIAVPLVVQDRVIGVLNLESERLGYFTEDHARTLSLLAPSVSIAVENARLYNEIGERERRMQEDLKAAFELQTVLLPSEAPPVQGLEIAIGLRPAREISGDLYDFFEHSDAQFSIAFGDSSGKGAAAALYGAMVNGRHARPCAAAPQSRRIC